MINIQRYHDAGFTTSQIRALERLLEENPLHWIQINNESGIYELVLDNQMMSDFRSCPAYFIEAHVKGIVGKGRSFDLDFGLLFHSMMEQYYREFRTPGFNVQNWAINTAVREWAKRDMNFHSEHKTYKVVGGVMGFVAILIAYANRFGAENERLRVIGTEISFGHKKEVELGTIWLPYRPEGTAPYLMLYLSGRIDVLVDDGTSIAPLDHKTMSQIKYGPTIRFEVDSGPTGYIYAISKILPSLTNDRLLLNRSCNKIIMNFISKTPTKDEKDRFKRIPIMKTQEQLESYRQRMLLTGEAIFRTLIQYASYGIVMQDTSKCTNWYMHDCLFLPIHRQNSKENELLIINQFYDKRPIWNTEEVR